MENDSALKIKCIEMLQEARGQDEFGNLLNERWASIVAFDTCVRLIAAHGRASDYLVGLEARLRRKAFYIGLATGLFHTVQRLRSIEFVDVALIAGTGVDGAIYAQFDSGYLIGVVFMDRMAGVDGGNS